MKRVEEDVSFDISHQIPSKDLLEAPRLRVGTDQQRRCVPPNALCPGAGHRDSHRGSELRGEQDPTCQYLRWHQGFQGMIRILTSLRDNTYWVSYSCLTMLAWEVVQLSPCV